MIVITGASGFIGSCLLGHFNRRGISDLIIVDDFSNFQKNKNLVNKKFTLKVDREDFIQYLEKNHTSINYIFHLGARTDTAETNVQLFNHLNLNYSKRIWEACSNYSIPLIYASSAATYGNGEKGFNDDHHSIPRLRPLNAYANSKHEFDKWVLKESATPPTWHGLKFFNVYGPNEYHKSQMASVILHAYKQIIKNGKVRLFKSHHPDIADGHQKRDFIYVQDLLAVMDFLSEKRAESGIYNLGTGNARTYLDAVTAIFNSIQHPPQIEFIDTPSEFRKNYQYFTEADMQKLRSVGYTSDFFSLEEGISDYIQNYLAKKEYF